MINVRPIKEEDWKELIPSWFEKYKDVWAMPERRALPNNGLGGMIVSNGDIPFACSFLFYTNSVTGIIEWTITDRDYREDNRDEGIELLIQELSNVAKRNGVEYIFAWIKNKKLINKYQNVGFLNSAEGVVELIKKI